MDTDRNLLFGVLALQLDLLDRDRFVEACAAWAACKDTPLADQLVERGWLTAEAKAHIDFLLECNLKKHGGDAHASLAAVAGPEVRRALDTVDDPAIGQSLASLPPVEVHASDLPTADALPAAGRYRVLRPHARGGLGEVFVAEDTELHREVALKQMQPRHADNADSRNRFLLEAEITGGLEHPGIVPVYGLNTYADGRPFYVMRFIQGQSLKEALQRFHQAPDFRGAAFRQLVRRFVDLCNAVAYAHSRGVLHRDLKPANVMLGSFGETLVVDWGLAKVVGRQRTGYVAATPEATLQPASAAGQAETVAGTALGTPAYMSPEQAAGRLEELGPASDVYSLGATLYAVLTGRAPFEGADPGAVLRQVQGGDFPPPRQVRAAVPLALNAVCQKAMARTAAGRYATPLALAADVEHWLADEPVTAYSEPWPARLARRARRHRTLVFSAGAALAVLAVSLGVLAAVLTKHNHDLQVANARERQARDQERDAKAQARNNFRLARQAVKDYCVQISLDPRLQQADLNVLRKQLFETAARFHEQFKEQEGDDPEVRAERADAYFELGFITQLTGSKEEAAGHYRQALVLWTALIASHPDNRDYRHGLADCYNSAASMYDATGRPKETEDAYLRSLALHQELVDTDPSDNRALAGLAQVQGNLALWYAQRQRIKEAEELYGKALVIHQRLVEASPGKAEPLRALADRRHKLGYLYALTKRHAQAGEAYQQALTIRQGLSRDHPDNLQYLEDLGWSHYNLGLWYRTDGQLRQAEAAYKQSVDVFRRLADARPSVPNYQQLLALALGDSGAFYQASGQTQQALDAYRQALEIQEKLAKLYPATVRYARLLGGSYNNMGLRLTQNGDPNAALPWLDKAQTTLEEVRRRDVSDVQARTFLRNTHWNRANALLKLGRPADALTEWDRVLELEGNGEDRTYLRMCRAVTLADLGQYEEAVSIAEGLVGPPETATSTVYVAACVFSRASASVRRDAKRAVVERQKLAEQHATRAVALLRRATQKGYKDFAHLMKDHDLDSLRQRPDFQQLLAELEAKAPAK